MRMAPDQFGTDPLQHLAHEEVLILSRDLGMQTDLQQEITQFLAEVLAIPLVQGFQDLISLLQQVGTQAQMGLFTIPWAAISAP